MICDWLALSRDGGWLAKAVAGKKTIAWLAVEDSFVRVTFYFGRLLPVAFEVRSSADVALVSAVLTIKLTAK